MITRVVTAAGAWLVCWGSASIVSRTRVRLDRTEKGIPMTAGVAVLAIGREAAS